MNGHIRTNGTLRCNALYEVSWNNIPVVLKVDKSNHSLSVLNCVNDLSYMITDCLPFGVELGPDCISRMRVSIALKYVVTIVKMFHNCIKETICTDSYLKI